MTISPDLSPERQALQDIVYMLSYAERRLAHSQIALLQKIIGCTSDLTIDRRRGNGAVKPSAKPKQNFTLTWRGSAAIPCTLYEAAEAVGKPPASLRAYISVGHGRYAGVDKEGDMYVVMRNPKNK